MDPSLPTVRLVAIDGFGAGVLGAMGPHRAHPEPVGEADVEVRAGRAPAPVRGHALTIIAGHRVDGEPEVVAIEGTEEWLGHAIAALLDVALLSGRVSIDLADIRAVFAGRGRVRGVAREAETLDEVGTQAISYRIDVITPQLGGPRATSGTWSAPGPRPGGIITNVTPFEPEWEGYVTLEISNTTPLPARIYANEGIAQVLFFTAWTALYASANELPGQLAAAMQVGDIPDEMGDGGL